MYRKLTEKEVEAICNSNTNCPEWVQNHINKYYPIAAVKVTVLVDSEYNDEGYDNKYVGLVVFDKDNNELPPIKGKSLEARESFINNAPYCGYSDDEFPEEAENETYLLNGKLPDLYILEE